MTLNTSANDPLNNTDYDQVPTIVTFGASWHPIKEFILNGDIDDLFSSSSFYTNSDFGAHLRLGFGYTLLGFLQLRGGLTNDNLSGGIGLLPLGLDYAYAMDNTTQSYNHYLEFNVLF
jgi:hypothetical protein